MSKEAEEYFGKNLIWNGTVIINPIDLMDGFLKSRVNAISQNETITASNASKDERFYLIEPNFCIDCTYKGINSKLFKIIECDKCISK